jgi:hypothetical protein
MKAGLGVAILSSRYAMDTVPAICHMTVREVREANTSMKAKRPMTALSSRSADELMIATPRLTLRDCSERLAHR